MDLQWWHWLVFGLFLVVVELAAAGGFYVIFFGISAILVGLLASVGAADSIGVQLILFSVLLRRFAAALPGQPGEAVPGRPAVAAD